MEHYIITISSDNYSVYLNSYTNFILDQVDDLFSNYQLMTSEGEKIEIAVGDTDIDTVKEFCSVIVLLLIEEIISISIRLEEVDYNGYKRIHSSL